MVACMHRSICIALLFVALACDSQAASGGPEAQNAAKPADPAPAKDAAPKDAAKRDKDKGHATVTKDGEPWTAEACRARLKGDAGDRLSISCNLTASTDGAVFRQEISLSLKDYKGAGDYEMGATGSHYAAVNVDTKAAATDPDKDSVLMDSIAGSTVIFLSGAKVTITAASDTAVDGTFSWAPEAGEKGPTLSDGRFHAVFRK